MNKVVRNTIYTVLAITMTSVGLKWNKVVNAPHQPIALQKAVLASDAFTYTTSLQFPLSITFDKPAVSLGQLQTVTINTVPFANLDIVTKYPDNTVDHPQSLTAKGDGNGVYSLTFKVSDFHYLGSFQVNVVASSGNQTSQTFDQFVVKTMGGDNQEVQASIGSTPLIP